MSNNNIQKLIKSLLKSDIIQEIIYTLIGCLLSFLVFLFIPKRWYFTAYLSFKSRHYPIMFISILFLIFVFLFILFNQSNSKTHLFKLNYKRNIILFSIFNYTIHCFLFLLTNFGIYFYKLNITDSLFLKYFLICRPFYLFNYFFLIFYILLPIFLYEIWKKIYEEKLAFFISSLSIIFLLKPFFIDFIIVIFFIVPYILYYFENIKYRSYTIKHYIFAGIFGTILFSCYCIYFLIIPIYLIISLLSNKKNFRENFKYIIIISLFVLLFSCWFWIPLLISFFINKANINRITDTQLLLIEFQIFDLSFAFSFLGAFFVISLILIIKNYKKSKDIQILGNLMLSSFILLLIAFIGFILNLFFIPLYYFRLHFYISIIVSCIFYVKFFNLINTGKIFKRYEFKGNFKQLEIFLLFFIMFSQFYFNVHNIYLSHYHRSALNQEDPEIIISSFYNEQDEEFTIPLTRSYEISIINSFFAFLYQLIGLKILKYSRIELLSSLSIDLYFKYSRKKGFHIYY